MRLRDVVAVFMSENSVVAALSNVYYLLVETSPRCKQYVFKNYVTEGP